MSAFDPTVLPADLPVPEDDGAADHLPGAAMPAVALPSTDGGHVRLDALGRGRTVLYAYPMTGTPGVDPPDGWDAIPGARGCTPETCAFRDHHADLADAGAAVYGLSTQTPEAQREAAERLHLPFALLSDAGLELTRALRLPSMAVDGTTMIRRVTLVVRDGRIEHVFYPVFPPDGHAAEVLAWLREHPVASLEIERKFLVTDVPEDLEWLDERALRQGYVALDGDTEVRVRDDDGEWRLTVKHGDGLRRLEEEIPIDTRRGEALWELTAGRRVEKRRRRMAYGSGMLELDVFEGALAGLVTLEVEFADVAASEAFVPPPWAGRELTGDVRWSNQTLAVHGVPGE